MAELPRFLVTQPTPRVAPGRTAQQVAPLARLDPAAAGAPGRALAGVGRATQQLGGVIDQVVERFKAAKALTEGDAAVTAYRDQSQADLLAAQKASEIDPDAFRAEQLEKRQQVADSLSPGAKARFLAQTQEVVFRASEKLITEDRRRTAAQGQATFLTLGDDLEREMVGAGPGESALLESAYLEDTAPYVATGLVKPGAREARITAARGQQVLAAIQVDPFEAENALLDGTLGARLLPRQKQSLIEIAQQQQRNLNAQTDRADRIQTAQKTQDQIANAGPFYLVVMDPEVTPAILEAQFTQLAFRAARGEIRTQDFTALSTTIDRKLQLATETAEQQREKNSADVRAGLEAKLFVAVTPDQRQDLLFDALARAADMEPTDFAAFLDRWNTFSDREHITNQPTVREGLGLIAQAFTGVKDPSALEVMLLGMSEGARRNLVTANVAYATRMERLRATTDPSLHTAREVAVQIIAEYGPGQASPQRPGLGRGANRGLPVGGTLPGAARTVPQGAPVPFPAEMDGMDYVQGVTHLRTLAERDNSEATQVYIGRLFDAWKAQHGRE